MNDDYQQLKESIISITSEFYRFKNIFYKAIGKLNEEEHEKYLSQYAWFEKKITNAIHSAGLRIIKLDGQLYDPGMAVTPLNIDDFDVKDVLYITQMIEPIIMDDKDVIRMGTVLLGRAKQ